MEGILVRWTSRACPSNPSCGKNLGTRKDRLARFQFRFYEGGIVCLVAFHNLCTSRALQLQYINVMLVHPHFKVLDRSAFQASEITVDTPQLPVEHGSMGLNTPLAVSTLPRFEVFGFLETTINITRRLRPRSPIQTDRDQSGLISNSAALILHPCEPRATTRWRYNFHD